MRVWRGAGHGGFGASERVWGRTCAKAGGCGVHCIISTVYPQAWSHICTYYNMYYSIIRYYVIIHRCSRRAVYRGESARPFFFRRFCYQKILCFSQYTYFSESPAMVVFKLKHCFSEETAQLRVYKPPQKFASAAGSVPRCERQRSQVHCSCFIFRGAQPAQTRGGRPQTERSISDRPGGLHDPTRNRGLLTRRSRDPSASFICPNKNGAQKSMCSCSFLFVFLVFMYVCVLLR